MKSNVEDLKLDSGRLAQTVRKGGGANKLRHLFDRSDAIASLPILVSFVAAWHVIATTLWAGESRLLPGPVQVGSELIRIAIGESELGSSSYEHILATLFRLGVGFTIAFVLGSILGVIAGRREFVFHALDSLVWTFMAIPSIVWAFIFVVAIGITDLVPIAALIALLAPGVLIAIAEGVKSIPEELLKLAESYKLNSWQRAKDLYGPFLVPYLVSSARVAFALGLRLIVIAEVVGLSRGIGFEMDYWSQQLYMAPIVAWGGVLIVIGLFLDYSVFGRLQKRFRGWSSVESERDVAEELWLQ